MAKVPSRRLFSLELAKSLHTYIKLKLLPQLKFLHPLAAGMSMQIDPKLKPSLLQKPIYIQDHIKIMKEQSQPTSAPAGLLASER